MQIGKKLLSEGEFLSGHNQTDYYTHMPCPLGANTTPLHA